MFTTLRHKYLYIPRLLIAVLMLVLVLGTIAHAGHDHSKEQQSRHQVCDYCVGYAHLGGSAAITVTIVGPVFTDEAPTAVIHTSPDSRRYSVAQPRAPPFC